MAWHDCLSARTAPPGGTRDITQEAANAPQTGAQAAQEKRSAWAWATLRGISRARRQAARRSLSSAPAFESPITSNGPVTGYAATDRPQASPRARLACLPAAEALG